MKNILTTILLLASGSILAQTGTGPGGVETSTNIKAWMDPSQETGFVDDVYVPIISDQSGNGNNFSNSLPHYYDPKFKTGVINGKSVLRFDGGDFLETSAISDLDTDHLSWIIVSNKQASTTQYTISTEYSSGSLNWGNYSLSSSDNIKSWIKAPGFKASSAAMGNDFVISSSVRTGNNFSVFFNSTNSYSNSTLSTTPNGHIRTRLGARSATASSFLIGDIAEVILYSDALNHVERVLVENYLSSKYAIAISNDYYSYDITHPNDVIGIGMEFGVSNDDAQGTGIIRIHNPDELSDGDYLLMGHDNEDLTSYSTSFPATLNPLGVRYKRTWRLEQYDDTGTLDFTWDMSNNGFGSASNYVMLVDNDGDFSDGNTTTYTSSSTDPSAVLFENVTIEDGDFITIFGVENGPIESIVASGDWSNPTSWDCGCVPSGNDKVTIKNGHTISMNVNGSTDILTVETGGTLNFSSNSELVLNGDFDLLGSLSMTQGKISFEGVSDQTFDIHSQSIEMNDLNLDNSNALLISAGTITINGTLGLTSGNLDISNSSTEFIIDSDASGDGRIGEINPASLVIGDITVRRFIPAGSADNRHLSSPLSNAKLAQWDNDLSISGSGFPDGCAANEDGCYYSVKYYYLDDYVDVTNYNTTLLPLRGYIAYCGDDLETFSGTTLNVKGTPNYGTPTIGTHVGWNLKGNPFASPIDYSKISRNNIGNYYYVYDTEDGNYQWWDGDSQTAGTFGSGPVVVNGIIASSQGYWMESVGSNGTMTVPQSAKTSTSATFLKTAPARKYFSLSISSDANTYKCGAGIMLKEFASNDQDTFDIPHLPSFQEDAPVISFLGSDERLYRLSSINTSEQSISIPLSVKTPMVDYYKIQVEQIENFDTYSCIKLIDNKTDEVIDLKRESSYTFFADINDEVYQRFTLVLSKEKLCNQISATSVNTITEDDLTVTQTLNTVNVDFDLENEEDVIVEVINELGQQIVSPMSESVTNQTLRMSIPSVYRGIHFVVVKTKNKTIVNKIFL